MRFYKLNKKYRVAAQKRQLNRGALVFALFAGAVYSLPATATEEQVCVPDTLPLRPLDPKYLGKDPSTLPIELEADQVEVIKDGPRILSGKAEINQGRKSISGDKLRYDEATDEVEAKGNVVLRTAGGDAIESSYLRYKVGTGFGYADEAEFQIGDRSKATGDSKTVAVKGRGKAKRIYFEGQDLMRLEGAQYTTCIKGQDDVILQASEIKLDQSTGVGVAKNATIKFKGVPLFYFPRISFPISDDRKSGFLFPVFGTQGDSGLVFAVPYYWNIAPNMDATITPRLMEKRGVMLEGEFRYLGENHAGVVRGAYLPSDNEYEGGDKDRGAFTYLHDQTLGDRWTANVNYQWASDEDYFDDFSNDIGLSSRTHLPQQATVGYRGKLWNFAGSLLKYQTIDKNISASDRPPDRLPRMVFSTSFPRQPGGLKYGVTAEVVSFEHDVNVAGTRVDLTPSISWPLEKIYGSFEPKMEVRYTSYYSLDNVAAGAETSPSRTVGIFSADARLFFERDTTWGGRPFIQTLEPRLFYVYAPKKDQDNLPIFDSGTLSLNNFGNLFKTNRFTGADRVGDANQVTLALTSRMLGAKSGKEWMRASIGQIYYFDDREVALTSTIERTTTGTATGSTATTETATVDTESSSDIFAELVANLNRGWSARAILQWDTGSDRVQESRVDVSYQPGMNVNYRPGPGMNVNYRPGIVGVRRQQGANKYVNFSYTFNRDSTDQANLSLLWPVSRRWSFMGRYRYSFMADQLLVGYAGLEYDACCWAVRVGAQRRVNNDEEYRNIFLVELELTGLTTIRGRY